MSRRKKPAKSAFAKDLQAVENMPHGTYQYKKNSGLHAVNRAKKLGRNDPCPCGKKKPDGTRIKAKNCHYPNI